jgi:hypothetical protein
MNRLDVLVDGELVAVSLDDTPADVDRIQGIIAIRLVDEWTREPPRTKVSVKTKYPGLSVYVSGDGAIGFAGIPRFIFPGLDLNPYPVELTIRADGYVTQKLSINVGPQPSFLTSFAPRTRDIFLHRLPVVIRGRTVLSNAGAITPIAGATVRITGIWRTPPPANATIPASPPNLINLEPPVYAERDAATGILRRCDLTPVSFEDKNLLHPCGIGSSVIHLTNYQNLHVGDVLRLDAEKPDRMEHIAVESITGGSTPDQEAEITLAHPAAREHRKNALVRRVTIALPGAANNLADQAISGDSTVFTNNLAGLTGADFARLEGGLDPAPEYHQIRLYSAVSGAEGFFRLPPISRTAWVKLEASDGVHAPVEKTVSPDYEEYENIVDFLFG